MNGPSCLYEGEVRHRRFAPLRHEFRYRLFMLYVDLDELPHLFRGRWLWSTRRPNIAWFRRADYLGSNRRPLAECVRDLVAERLGRRPGGPVRLLTHFRYFGFAMNPISLYYCFDADDRLDAVVAEVSNTPWNERHCYVLDACEHATTVRAQATKTLHVSPFLDMDYDYAFELTEPAASLRVRVANHRRSETSLRPVFDAELELERRPLSGRAFAHAVAVPVDDGPCVPGHLLAGLATVDEGRAVRPASRSRRELRLADDAPETIGNSRRGGPHRESFCP